VIQNKLVSLEQTVQVLETPESLPEEES